MAVQCENVATERGYRKDVRIRNGMAQRGIRSFDALFK
jgi:hypothetical protein